MDIKLSIKNDFETIYLINGRMLENGEIYFGQNEVVYITVLPLDPVLLPYTVKLVGGRVKKGELFAKTYMLDKDRFVLKLLPRYSYIYSTSEEEKIEKDVVERFFSLVRGEHLLEARELMTSELSESIDDKSLADFFEGRNDIVAENKSKGRYYLIDSEGNGVLCSFVIRSGKIDNIIEE
jgi:hypothetical protein